MTAGLIRKILFIAFLVVLLPGCYKPGTKSSSKKQGNEPGITIYNDNLDPRLRENSGLIYFRNRLWTINDSGGEPALYAFDARTGTILQTISVQNAKNVDWEDIAQDDRYIFIADIGNNYGTREILTVYKVVKEMIPQEGDGEVEATMISFNYGDRPRKVDPGKSPYDAEAITVWNDTLLLFTKDWQDQQTVLYKIPAGEGEYSVYPVAGFNSKGLITGADISSDGRLLILVGYRDHMPFILVFSDYQWPDVLSGKTRRFDFPQINNVQSEGVTFKNMKEVFISAEMGILPAQLFLVNLGDV